MTARGCISARLATVLPVVLTLIASSNVGGAQSIVPVTEGKPPLGLDQVLSNLTQKNAQRAAALQAFEGKRIYRMQYRGFAGDKDAEMVVRANFRAPNSKEFTVLSQSGSKFVIEHVFKKLLQSEQQALKDDNGQGMALTRENYDFELAGYETTPQGGQYVLRLLPRTKNKYLYRGTIWIDAKDFAVVRIEGEPGKNPSIWTRKTDIMHRYEKVNGFWLPAENHTESSIRFGGKATLSIEYQDYKVTQVQPQNANASSRKNRPSFLEGIALDNPAVWANGVPRRGAH